MNQFFSMLDHALDLGRSFVLAGIVSSSGSAPRSSGAKMAVFENGETAGTVGGGAVEYASIREALDNFGKKASWTRTFSLTEKGENALNMACGGQVEVSFVFVDKSDQPFRELFARIKKGFNENQDLWLVTKCDHGAVTDMGVYDPVGGLHFFRKTQYLSEDQQAQLFKSDPTVLPGEPSFMAEPLNDSGYTYIFGGGHVAQALVPVIAAVDFKPVIYEDREDFCQPGLFPGVHHVIRGDFGVIKPQVSLTSKDYVVIMTRGHAWDYQVLAQVLKSPSAYIGVMGSRNKIRATKERLLADGFSEEAMERIHWPIGLAIKAQTPAEIAVSVGAELILCRAQLREAHRSEQGEKREGRVCPAI